MEKQNNLVNAGKTKLEQESLLLRKLLLVLKIANLNPYQI